MSSIPPVSSEKFYGLKPADKKSTLDMKAFLTLLTKQLSYQNPLQPMNDRDFFAQMAQLGQVQGMDQLNNASEVQQIQSMIGKTVTAVRPMTEGDGTNALVTGVATRLLIRDGERLLVLRQPDGGEVEVKPANVQDVRTVPLASEYTNLIGKSVEGPNVTGTVAAVKVANDEIVLSVKSGGSLADLPLSAVTSIGG